MRLWYGRNFVGAVIVFATATLRGADVFVECESFDNLGGWVVDSYSMRSMGSAYVMAHGCGKPVADAVGTVSVPAKGTYTAWARTRNWNAEWTKGAAGRFKVKVNGADLPGTLGVGDGSWSWCKVGEVSLPAGRAEIALHDLTGFNGRCDALFLTTEAGTRDACPYQGVAAAAEKARAERRGKVENACMKIIGATIELAVQGKGAWRSTGTMSKLALASVADMKKEFVKRCASRKYDIKKLAVYEFDQLFVVGPVWWLMGIAETPEEHRTNY